MTKHIVRRLTCLDRNAISDHFMRLDPNSLRLRFGYSVSDEYMRKYVEDVLKPDNPTYGVIVGREIRAIAQMFPLAGIWSKEFEVAFSVESEWQDQGLGNALITRIIAVAQNRGVKMLHLLCLRENKRMQHLAIKHSGELTFDGSDVVATLGTPWPTFSSVIEEALGETRAFAQAFLKFPAPNIGLNIHKVPEKQQIPV